MKISPNKIYSNGFEVMDFWEEAKRHFNPSGVRESPFKNPKKFYTEDKFRLVINLGSMAGQEMHGSGSCLVNAEVGIQLEFERGLIGAGDMNCHVFFISDSQMNIMGRQLEDVEY